MNSFYRASIATSNTEHGKRRLKDDSKTTQRREFVVLEMIFLQYSSSERSNPIRELWPGQKYQTFSDTFLERSNIFLA